MSTRRFRRRCDRRLANAVAVGRSEDLRMLRIRFCLTRLQLSSGVTLLSTSFYAFSKAAASIEQHLPADRPELAGAQCGQELALSDAGRTEEASKLLDASRRYRQYGMASPTIKLRAQKLLDARNRNPRHCLPRIRKASPPLYWTGDPSFTKYIRNVVNEPRVMMAVATMAVRPPAGPLTTDPMQDPVNLFAPDPGVAAITFVVLGLTVAVPIYFIVRFCARNSVDRNTLQAINHRQRRLLRCKTKRFPAHESRATHRRARFHDAVASRTSG